MPERTLKGCHILVVEDEYMLANELSRELDGAGAVVVGPAPSVERALDLIGTEARPDGAILDVSLGGERVDPVADVLLERGVPFLFVTGYDSLSLGPKFADIVRCEKPVDMRVVTKAIGRIVS